MEATDEEAVDLEARDDPGLTDAALGLAVGGSTSDNPFSNSCHSGEDGSCNGGCWWRHARIE
jgi:hypothetical protein